MDMKIFLWLLVAVSCVVAGPSTTRLVSNDDRNSVAATIIGRLEEMLLRVVEKMNSLETWVRLVALCESRRLSSDTHWDACHYLEVNDCHLGWEMSKRWAPGDIKEWVASFENSDLERGANYNPQTIREYKKQKKRMLIPDPFERITICIPDYNQTQSEIQPPCYELMAGVDLEERTADFQEISVVVYVGYNVRRYANVLGEIAKITEDYETNRNALWDLEIDIGDDAEVVLRKVDKARWKAGIKSKSTYARKIMKQVIAREVGETSKGF